MPLHVCLREEEEEERVLGHLGQDIQFQKSCPFLGIAPAIRI
jgi:hypothetical protein